ncbi:MAG: TIM barrel protein [Firmicutes bacterium]|nr:TIM barrel protein [Bacillota bacterium]
MIGIVQDKRSFSDPQSFLHLAYELGANHVEFKYEERLAQSYNLRGDVTDRLRQFAERCKMTVSVHAPYDNDLSFGSPDADKQTKIRLQMLECLEFAERIGACYITVHGGSMEVSPSYDVKADLGKPNRITLRDKVSRDILASLRERTLEDLAWFIACCQSKGVVVALENYHDFSFFKLRYPIYPADFEECYRTLGNVFSMNFDSGHAHSTGIHIVDFINQIGVDRIAGTHLHDNHEVKDEHLPIFEGTIDFRSFFQSYHAEGWQFPLNIEVKEAQALLRGWRSLQEQVAAYAAK